MNDAPSNGILETSEPIDHDTPCRGCEYNLRGLTPEGRCPECGLAIGLSIKGDLLRYADPNWVETVVRGLKFIVGGLVATVLLSVGAGCLVSTLGGSYLLVSAVGYIGSLLTVYGAWLMTTPDPQAVVLSRLATTRRVVRVTLLVGLLAAPAMHAADALASAGVAWLLLAYLLSLATQLIWIVGGFAQLYYVEKLADRVPDPMLVRRARFLRWALTTTGVVGLLLASWTSLPILGASATAPTASAPASAPTTLPTSAPFPPPPGVFAPRVPGRIVMFAAGIVGIVGLVFGVMAFFLYVRLGRRFREQIDFARATWAADAPRNA